MSIIEITFRVDHGPSGQSTSESKGTRHPNGALSTPYFFNSSRIARVNLVTCCSSAPPTAPLIHESVSRSAFQSDNLSTDNQPQSLLSG